MPCPGSACVVAAALLRELGTTAEADGFALGLLFQREQARADAGRSEGRRIARTYRWSRSQKSVDCGMRAGVPPADLAATDRCTAPPSGPSASAEHEVEGAARAMVTAVLVAKPHSL